ncbi:MAG: tetratricopeptide repeat protein [Deltaproteobacteria bacterium]|nr:tetratricopeptide repeat protein [Deltaproteobacteria bacterium]
MIRAIVARVCPGELLLVDTAEAPLPEWVDAAVTGAANDLDRRLAAGESVGANDYLRLAIVENVLGLHVEAESHLKEALPRSDQFGAVLNALAVTSLARGKLGPAIVYSREALRETGGDDSIRAAASSNLGDFCRLQGDAAQAVAAYETAMDCLGPEGDARWLSRLHLRAGRLYRGLDQKDKARLHLADSVRLLKDSGDDIAHVRALAELGSALNDLGLHDMAIRHFEGAIRICLKTGDKHGAALVQGEMGVAYMAQEQLTRALTYFDSALSLYRELGDRAGEAATLGNIAKIHDFRGDADEARKFHEASLGIRDQGHEAGDEDGAAARQPEQKEEDHQ